MALFNGTRGLFTGWLKGLTMMALAPLFAVLGGSIMLELAVPVLTALVKPDGTIDQQAAMAFFLVGAVHVALMLMALKVAGTMVSGWQVFGLVPHKERGRDSDAPRTVPVAAPVAASMPRNTNVAPASPGLAPRRVDIASAMPTVAANDAGPAGTVSRETRVLATSSGGVQVVPLKPVASRTSGIGNRFRSATNSGAAKPAAQPPTETYQ
jgi:type IV secretion system protein VirB6